MKVKALKYISALLLVYFTTTFACLSAQETIILDGFTGVPQAGQIQLRWVISAGQTCNGTFIERSTDTLNWQNIGDIPGVCGSSSAAVPYNFIDDSPETNTINFYRLELGGQGYSPVIAIPYYDYSQKGYVVIPNPARESTKFYFSTSETEEFTIALFDINGKFIHNSSGTGSSYTLDLNWIPSGTYIFKISRRGKNDVTGKLIVNQ
jgi:hypothetical protein